MIVGSKSPVVVRLSTKPGGGLEKSRPSSLPGTPTVADEHLDRGYVNLFFLLWEERRMISHGTLEG
jgi:hypothetical protein